MRENHAGFGRSGEMSDSPSRIKLRREAFRLITLTTSKK
jgi:hypothetical protein